MSFLFYERLQLFSILFCFYVLLSRRYCLYRGFPILLVFILFTKAFTRVLKFYFEVYYTYKSMTQEAP